VQTITIKISSLAKLVVFTSTLSFCAALALLPQPTCAEEKFNREEMLVLNLSHSKGSAGYFLLEAERLQKEVTHNLWRALSQVQQVEQSYAKSKGKPDQKYLDASQLQLVNARQRSEELTEYISTTFRQMKRSVKETLLKP
jgi:hypothetical protein